MKNHLIIAGCIIIIGIVLFVCIMGYLKWDFSALSLFKSVMREYEITDPYKNISIKTETADVTLLPSSDGKTKVTSIAHEKLSYSVFVEGETLVITLNDTRAWYEKINTRGSTLTVYLPADEYGALVIDLSTGDTEISDAFSFGSVDVSASTGDVECFASVSGGVNIGVSTGDILVEGASVGSLTITASTGDVEVKSLNCLGNVSITVSTGDVELTQASLENLVSVGSTGDIKLVSVAASQGFNLERSTGNVIFNGCDANDIFVKTTTGSVKGSFLTEKIIFASTGTGRVDVPESTIGGKCKVETSTGDIILEICE